LTADISSLCELGEVAVDPVDGKTKCDQLKSVKVPDATTGLVECNFATGETCPYTSVVSKTTYTDTCTCGFNETGKSYCPRKQDNEYAWFPLFVLRRESYANGCHTKSRFTCYLNKKKKVLTQINEMRRNSIDLAKFYGAPDCSVVMLSSTYLFASYFAAVLSVLVFMF